MLHSFGVFLVCPLLKYVIFTGFFPVFFWVRIFRGFFVLKGGATYVFISFCTMDISRCVLITAEERIWVSVFPYLFKKREKYNWIVHRLKDAERSPNDKVEVYIWWSGEGLFSSTPLCSHLKRLKQKDGVKKRAECFKISRKMKTKNILKKLVDSTQTHDWDDSSFICKELSEYLEAGVLRLKKAYESKVTKEMGAEVTEQQSEPQPNTLQQSEPQPNTLQQSEPQPSTSQAKDDEKREDNNQRVRLSQNQINGLVLKLLTHTSSSVTSVTKDICVVSGKLDRLTETFRSEMIKINSKMDKLAEAFNHKLYDPLFDDNFCTT